MTETKPRKVETRLKLLWKTKIKKRQERPKFASASQMRTVLKFQIENRGIERCITVNIIFLDTLDSRLEYRFGPCIVMGTELGNETDVDIFLVSPLTPPQNFTLIGNDIFFAEFSVKSQCFGVFADISLKSSPIINMS